MGPIFTVKLAVTLNEAKEFMDFMSSTRQFNQVYVAKEIKQQLTKDGIINLSKMVRNFWTNLQLTFFNYVILTQIALDVSCLFNMVDSITKRHLESSSI